MGASLDLPGGQWGPSASRRSRFKAIAARSSVGVLLFVAACGGGSSGPSPAPTSLPPAPRLVQQGNFSLAAPDLDADVLYFATVPVSDAATGLWEATVDWALTQNTHWMWVANGVCSGEQFALPECPFEATCPCQFTVRSEIATPKPRVLSIPNAAGGTRTLIVLNLGPREDDFTYRVMLTPSSNVVRSESGAPASTAPLSVGRKTMPGRR